MDESGGIGKMPSFARNFGFVGAKSAKKGIGARVNLDLFFLGGLGFTAFAGNLL